MSLILEVGEMLRQGEYRPTGCYLVRNVKTGKVLITQSEEEEKLNEWAIPQGGFEYYDESAEGNLRGECLKPKVNSDSEVLEG